MLTPFVVPPLGGIASVNSRLKPVQQTAIRVESSVNAIESQARSERRHYISTDANRSINAP
jgi:hypothetical protein